MHNYTMLGQQLETVTSYPYLGVNLSNNLKWDTHVAAITSKANKSLGFLRRNLYMCPEKVKAQAYTALIRPTLEYASSAWDPYRQTHINQLEAIQRKAARFATKCYSRKPGCVTAALQHLKWNTLEERRRIARLSLLHKGTINQAAITVPPYIQTQQHLNTRRSHHLKYIPPQPRTDIYKQSFFPRTIMDWNNLPNNIIESQSTTSFKLALAKHFNAAR